MNSVDKKRIRFLWSELNSDQRGLHQPGAARPPSPTKLGRLARKHYIKPAPVEAIAAMRQLSDTFANVETPKLLANDPQTGESEQHRADAEWLQ